MTTLKEYKAIMEGATDAVNFIQAQSYKAERYQEPIDRQIEIIRAFISYQSELIRVIELAEEKLAFIADGCLVPPDGGSPDICDYMKAANEALSEIRKLKGE